MKGLAEMGVLIIFVAAAILMLSSFTFDASAAPQASGGNWTNASIISYPTNFSNVSDPWVVFNYSINDSQIQTCLLEIGNTSGAYQNLSCSENAGDLSCTCNATYLTDTPAGLWYNITLFAFNDTHQGIISNTSLFRVDTTAPVITVLNITKHNSNGINESSVGNLTINGSQWITGVGGGDLSPYQDFLNITFTVLDDSVTELSKCGVDIIRETISSAGIKTDYSYRNYTFSQNLTRHGVTTDRTREYDSLIPATYITDGVYQGKFWLQPHCTDESDFIGYSGKNYWGVVNPIPANTWTPLAVVHSNGLPIDAWINQSSFLGNISYVALVYSNGSGFITYQYGASSDPAIDLNLSNASSVYVFSSNGWTMARLNHTNLEGGNDYGIKYNDSGGAVSGNWRMFPNLRANTTKYIANTSASCGRAFDWIAWFNSSDDTCAGGCWSTYSNGWGFNNETEIPFGTAVWYLTNETNITVSPPAYDLTTSAVGNCLQG